MATFDTGEITSYSFPLLGNEILLNIVDSALPIPYVPIETTNIPGGWTKIGPIRDSLANITFDLNTEELVTGLTPTNRREVITGQSGLVEAFLQRFEPDTMQRAYNFGTANRLNATTSSSRAYTDLWLGGSLGSNFAMIITGDPDIDLVTDNGVDTFEQVWIYTPRGARTGQISLSERNKRAPEVPFRAKFLGYTNPGAPGRTVLAQVRWLENA